MASANTLPTLSQGPPFVPQGLTKAQVQETYHVSHSTSPTTILQQSLAPFAILLPPLISIAY